MLIGVRGEGRPGLDMTGGTSGGRPGLSSQLCKMKDISSSVAPAWSSPQFPGQDVSSSMVKFQLSNLVSNWRGEPRAICTKRR